jgi:acetylornithine deacetylase/succinyl-diaminopimelate desuccinylase family protein
MNDPINQTATCIAIDPHEVTDLASALIRIPTVPSVYPPGEAEAVGYLAHLLDREGIAYHIEEVLPSRPNLIAEMGDGSGRTLWLNGHIDTVPIGNRLNWRSEPFGGDQHDSRLYGRGASDCKGGVAAMIHAAIALRRAGIRLKGTLRLTAVMGEEEGQIGIRHLLDAGLGATAFVSTQWSTATQIALAYRGLCWVEVTTIGRAAHGSRPYAGVNAVEHMLDLVLPALRSLELSGGTEPPFDLPGPSVNLGSILGGEAVNIVPDLCRATLDYRLTSGQCSNDVVTAIDEVLARLRREHPQLTVERRILLQAEPFFTDPACELGQVLTRAIERVAGVSPRLFGKAETSDANLVFQRLDIPVVAYGPGNDSGHTPDEFILIEDLARVSEVYAVLAMEYLGFDGAPASG